MIAERQGDGTPRFATPKRFTHHERRLGIVQATKDPHKAIGVIWRAAPWPLELKSELLAAADALGIVVTDSVFAAPVSAS